MHQSYYDLDTAAQGSSSGSGPNRFSVLWGLALAGFSLTLFISLPYLACLLTRPPSKIRRFYLSAALLPLVFAVSALSICLVPDSEDVWELVRHITEAWALHSLNQLIVERLGGKTSTLLKLKARGPQQWLRTPPFCCFCTFLPSKPFDEDTLHFVLMLTRQFLIAAPSISLIAILVSFSSLSRGSFVWQLLRFCLLGSSFLALWGLFILWKASLDDVSSRHQISMKFVSIKLLIIIGVIQEFILNEIYANRKPSTNTEDLSVLVPNALLASESPLLTLLILYAFPLRELEPMAESIRRAASLPPLNAASSLLGSSSSGGGLSSSSRTCSPGRIEEGGEGEGEEESQAEPEDLGVGELLFTSRGSSSGWSTRGGGDLVRTLVYE